jgi:serine/threonine protein kinase
VLGIGELAATIRSELTSASDTDKDSLELVAGNAVGEGAFVLCERIGLIGLGDAHSVPRLPFQNNPLLPGPEQRTTDVIQSGSHELQSWSSYYSSSFYISSCAGRGANGEVWRGISLDGSNSHIVLKRIFGGKSADRIASAMREVFFGRKFGESHSNVSRYVSHFLENGDLWLVFRDEGISLYQAVFQPVVVGQLSVMTRSSFWYDSRKDSSMFRKVFSQVLSGIASIHSEGIVHRDTKLENVFYDPNSHVVRIGDFGSACLYPATDISSSLFPPDGRVSSNEETSRYAPPEVDDEMATHREPSFDIWCVGIMWIEMFIGSTDLGSGRTKICKSGGCSKSQLAADLIRMDPLGIGMTDDEMLEVVWRMLAWVPSERPTAKTILEKFKFFAENNFSSSALVAQPTLSYRVASDIGKRRNMEDRILVDENGDFFLGCVFDGHNGASVAEYARKKISEYVFGDMSVLTIGLAHVLSLALDRVSRDVLNDPVSFSDSVGSTAACVLIDRSTGLMGVANIGDSRVVLVEEIDRSEWIPVVGGRIRTGEKIHEVVRSDLVIVGEDRRKAVRNPEPPLNCVRVTPLTVDHKPGHPSERAFIELAGGVVSESSSGMSRVNGELAVSRSIGARALQPFVRSVSDTSEMRLKMGMRVCIATDGVFDVLSNQEVGELGGPSEVIRAALDAGGSDNLAMVEVGQQSRRRRPDNEL